MTLKYKKKRVTATCDCCGKVLEIEMGVIVDGNHFKYGFGFGTDYDGKILDVTLCDWCIAQVLGKIGEIK